MSSAPPLVRDRRSLAAWRLKDVRVEGRYRQIDLARPTARPQVLLGHAAIELDDGALVLLEPAWERSALRSQAEIARCEGRRVAAYGLLFPAAPPDLSSPGALNPRLPCLGPVTSLEPLDD